MLRRPALIAVALLLSACDPTRPGAAPDAVPTTSRPAPDPWLCGTPVAEGHGEDAPLPADFRPVTVYFCGGAFEMPAGGRAWRLTVQRRADAGFAPVVEGLRQPDDVPQSGCWADLTGPGIEVWLVDATGQAVRPRVPLGYCHVQSREVQRALDQLVPVHTEKRRTRAMDNLAPGSSGCARSIGDVFGEPVRATGRGSFTGLSGPRVCRYRADGSRAFTGAMDLWGYWGTLVRTLEATGPARPCTTRATAVAVLGGEAPAYVELDGCRRILTPDRALRQADDLVIQELSPTR